MENKGREHTKEVITYRHVGAPEAHSERGGLTLHHGAELRLAGGGNKTQGRSIENCSSCPADSGRPIDALSVLVDWWTGRPHRQRRRVTGWTS